MDPDKKFIAWMVIAFIMAAIGVSVSAFAQLALYYGWFQ